MTLTQFLDQHDIVYRVYHHGETYDAQHMAQSVHVPGRIVAKAVMVRAGGGPEHLVLLVPATKRVDLHSVSELLGGVDVELANEQEILKRCPGCKFGVVPAFGSHFGMETIVDDSIAKQDEIVVQGDNHEEAVRLRFADYYAVEHPRVASITQSNTHAEPVA